LAGKSILEYLFNHPAGGKTCPIGTNPVFSNREILKLTQIFSEFQNFPIPKFQNWAHFVHSASKLASILSVISPIHGLAICGWPASNARCFSTVCRSPRKGRARLEVAGMRSGFQPLDRFFYQRVKKSEIDVLRRTDNLRPRW
jgi:hypothetical protein